MGDELAQWHEWDHEGELDWALLGSRLHDGVLRSVADLNRLHRDVPALHELDTDPRGFEWTQPNDAEAGLLSFLRFSAGGEPVLVVCNFTPVVRTTCWPASPAAEYWRELLEQRCHRVRGRRSREHGGRRHAPRCRTTACPTRSP